ncbi:MAG TPA: diguanylate cyclase [Thermoleophilaceae bacterium]|nr:diguanylate cyclase [Thermoleophilaceae bacterium]
MSFRGRLLLFFTIIVVIPMIAVAVVLFHLTGDSETGKADAEIAQGMRSAFAIYDDKRDDARDPLDAVAGDAELGRLLAHPSKPAAIKHRLRELAREHPTVVAIGAYGADREQLARTGARDAVASEVASPSTAKGKRLGFVAVSTTHARDYAREVKRLTSFDVRMTADGRLIASTVGRRRGSAELESGDTTIAGEQYRGRVATLPQVVGPPIQLAVFEKGADIDTAIRNSRLLIGSILAAFLLLALASSVVVVRALQGQVEQFLHAARRLAHGDFSEPVPVEGADEFAALGTEFNLMSRQLASKIDEVERKRGELEETIRRVGDAFAAGLDREGIVNLTLRTAVEACEAETGRALPIDARRMRSARVGDSTPELEAALEAAERAAFAVDPQTGPNWLASLEGSTGDDSPTEQHRPSKAVVDDVYALAAPLVGRLGTSSTIEQVGVVSIARAERPFDEQEYELFAYLTGQAAVSIENVDLHETVRLQAVTDELTGLYNRNHFQDTLDSEIERSRRFGTDVGVVMLDIDDFKQVNDTYGHPQGDIVLVEVGRVLRELSRDIDEPARYGGEELAVILPQTDLNGAELLAERMRSAIADLQIKRTDGGGELQVTASFGVASLPACANDRESLIAEADAALYRAKRAGKNRVVRGEPVAAEG